MSDDMPLKLPRYVFRRANGSFRYKRNVPERLLAPYNICFFRTNIEAMDRFYMDVLTLGNEKPFELQSLNQANGLAGVVSLITDGAIQVHLTPKEPS